MALTYSFKKDKNVNFPIVAIAGENDTVFTKEHLEPWGELSDAGFKLEIVSGATHLFARDKKDAVLKLLKDELLEPAK